MKKESLNKAINSIMETIDKLDIPIEEKVELIINISKFLAPDEYRENIKTLSLRRKK